MSADGVCRRDAAMRILAAPPMSLSYHCIASLRVTDLTEDGGVTWRGGVFTGRGDVALTREAVHALRVYIFRNSRRGDPFRDWRPDIGPYVFQGCGHHALGHMRAMTVRRHIRAA